MQHAAPSDLTEAEALTPAPAPSPADIRSAEILALVRSTFVDKGFDGASMQDLARAAGMSVGNFYRYFPSKSAIIQALIRADSADVQRDFAAILAAPRPLAQLRLVMAQHVLDENCTKDMDLWAEIEAAARRNPDIAEAARQLESEVIASFAAVFAAELGISRAAALERFSTLATYLLVQVKAATCLSAASPQDRPGVRALILANLQQVLDQAFGPDPTPAPAA